MNNQPGSLPDLDEPLICLDANGQLYVVLVKDALRDDLLAAKRYQDLIARHYKLTDEQLDDLERQFMLLAESHGDHAGELERYKSRRQLTLERQLFALLRTVPGFRGGDPTTRQAIDLMGPSDRVRAEELLAQLPKFLEA